MVHFLVYFIKVPLGVRLISTRQRPPVFFCKASAHVPEENSLSGGVLMIPTRRRPPRFFCHTSFHVPEEKNPCPGVSSSTPPRPPSRPPTANRNKKRKAGNPRLAGVLACRCAARRRPLWPRFPCALDRTCAQPPVVRLALRSRHVFRNIDPAAARRRIPPRGMLLAGAPSSARWYSPRSREPPARPRRPPLSGSERQRSPRSTACPRPCRPGGGGGWRRAPPALSSSAL